MPRACVLQTRTAPEPCTVAAASPGSLHPTCWSPVPPLHLPWPLALASVDHLPTRATAAVADSGTAPSEELGANQRPPEHPLGLNALTDLICSHRPWPPSSTNLSYRSNGCRCIGQISHRMNRLSGAIKRPLRSRCQHDHLFSSLCEPPRATSRPEMAVFLASASYGHHHSLVDSYTSRASPFSFSSPMAPSWSRGSISPLDFARGPPWAKAPNRLRRNLSGSLAAGDLELSVGHAAHRRGRPDPLVALVSSATQGVPLFASTGR